MAYDPYPNPACQRLGVEYVDIPSLLAASDVVSLHCPLTPNNYHLINADTLAHLKPGAMLINTSRGALLDTPAVITAIKSGRVGYLGIDVYEQEEALFFEDLSNTVIQDDTFQLLQSFHNVVITAHQAFFTHEALREIAASVAASVNAFANGARTADFLVA